MLLTKINVLEKASYWLVCVVCGEGFEARRSFAKYCGSSCRKAAQRKNKVPKPKKSTK